MKGLLLIFAIVTWALPSYGADEGIITKPSKYSVQEIVGRFETAVKLVE